MCSDHGFPGHQSGPVPSLSLPDWHTVPVPKCSGPRVTEPRGPLWVTPSEGGRAQALLHPHPHPRLPVPGSVLCPQILPPGQSYPPEGPSAHAECARQSTGPAHGPSLQALWGLVDPQGGAEFGAEQGEGRGQLNRAEAWVLGTTGPGTLQALRQCRGRGWAGEMQGACSNGFLGLCLTTRYRTPALITVLVTQKQRQTHLAGGSQREQQKPPRGCGPGICGVLRNQAPGEALPRSKAKPFTR